MVGRATKDPDFIKLMEEVDLNQLAISLKEAFSDMTDPRLVSRTSYPFWFPIFAILCGYLSESNTLSRIVLFIECRIDWLNALIQENFSAPSYNTVWWVLTRVSPMILQQTLKRWISHLPEELKNKLFVIDGKRLRGSSSQGKLTHLVELFAAENRLALAWQRVPHSSSEPDVLEALIQDIDISGSIVSTDALFAKTSYMEKILAAKADYIIGLKKNQRYFHQATQIFFEQAHQNNCKSLDRYISPIEKGHGRTEQRWVSICSQIPWTYMQERWPGLKSVIEVKSEREVKGKKSSEIRYYFSSHTATAQEFAGLIWNHWG